jgi:hypothetical protein
VADIGRKARQEAAHGAKADKPKGTSRSVDYRIREPTAGLLASAMAHAKPVPPALASGAAPARLALTGGRRRQRRSVSRRARRRERKVEKQAAWRPRSDVTGTRSCAFEYAFEPM